MLNINILFSKKVDGKWREVLVDYHEDQLRFVLSPSDTVATAMLKDVGLLCFEEMNLAFQRSFTMNNFVI